MQIISLIYNRATMPSVEYLGEFVNERLTAAAKEIFGVFKRIIVEYEEEINRQRRLLDIIWKPEIKLHRIELPQHHVCKEEEVLSDQQLCIQEISTSVDQEDTEPPQVKEEQEELCTSQEGEQPVLKQETDAFMLTPTDEESDHGEDQTLYFNPEKYLSAEQTELSANVCSSWLKDKSDCDNCEESRPNGDHRILLHNSHVAESHDQKRDKHGESPTNVGLKLQNQHHKSNSHYGNTHTDKRSFKCGMCGRAFKCKSNLKRHLIIHTDEKPYSCNTCGKKFNRNSGLVDHMRIHAGEKPYTCNTCGKGFRSNSQLIRHMKTHTDEKPYSCKTCWKDFRTSTHLIRHMRIHTGERPYTCKTCGKDFGSSTYLIRHIRTHTGEKPYSCKTCWKDFRTSTHLIRHMRIHTRERPYTCKTCRKDFGSSTYLIRHTRTHTGEKPYSCTTCGKHFGRNSDLIVHVRRIHTGEKPYLCKICGKRCCDSSDLAKHKRSHKGKGSSLVFARYVGDDSVLVVHGQNTQ